MAKRGKKHLHISDSTKIAVCIFVIFGSIVWTAYINPIIRLEHFAFLATILGSFATASTLIWLVIERDQLQKEKREDAKRKQATGVSTWLSKKHFPNSQLTQQIVVLNNNSDAPIYNIVVSIVDTRSRDAKGEKTPAEFQLIVDAAPPGQSFCFAPQGYGGMGFHPGVEIAFSDTNGRHWVRRGNGQLRNLPRSPFTHYKVPQPPIYESIQML